MLGGRTVRELYRVEGQGRSLRGIADDLGISRATVRKYVRSQGVPKPRPRSKRGVEAGRVHRVHRRQVGGGT